MLKSMILMGSSFTKGVRLLDQLIFGTAGVPLSAKEQSSLEGIARVRELGLGCMELEFVNGVRMSEKTAGRVGERAREFKVELSAHGPYWINLNSKDPEKIVVSRHRIVNACEIAALCGVHSVVFHAAFNHDDPPETVMERVVDNLLLVKSELDERGVAITLRPETTGKATQFGSLEEVIEVSRRVPGALPCIDFGHLHARSVGAYNTIEEFRGVLNELEKGLGRAALDNVHFHVSGINYGAKGEKNHLLLEESDLDYRSMVKAFKEFDLKGLVICESPNIETDALKLQDLYTSY